MTFLALKTNLLADRELICRSILSVYVFGAKNMHFKLNELPQNALNM